MKKTDIEKAISEMKDYVPVRLIERHLGMPKTTLQKVLKGQRELPKKWQKPLEAYFGKNPESISKEPPKQKAASHTSENKPQPTINGRPKNLLELKELCPKELTGQASA